MQKYQKIFQLMMEQNKELFDNFRPVHDAFAINQEVNRERFNQLGSEVLDVIRQYERILCGKSENGGFGKFSTNLSQKFWDEVRKIYPKIDFVGIK